MARDVRRTKVLSCAPRDPAARRLHRRFGGPLRALLAGGALLLAGCGAGAAPQHGASTGPATVVTLHVSGYGVVLATPAGHVLYLLSTDPPDGSRCAGSCAAQWRPLTDPATPSA